MNFGMCQLERLVANTAALAAPSAQASPGASSLKEIRQRVTAGAGKEEVATVA